MNSLSSIESQNFHSTFILFFPIFHLFSVVVEEPEFTEVIENVTVPAGRNVHMACSVKNLGTFKASV